MSCDHPSPTHLLHRIRSSHATVARLFALLIVLPLSNSVCSARTADQKPLALTFAQLATCPITGLAQNSTQIEVISLPDSIRNATGHEVVIMGYMLPLVMENGRASQLLLMRNQMSCCYGQAPVANEYLVIKTSAPGLPVTMDVPIAVQGTLRVAPVTMGGVLVEYFHLDDAVLAAR